MFLSPLDVARQATLKGSTMDPIALREFLHVLSLEYSNGTNGTKGARILASLPPANTAAATTLGADGSDGGGGVAP